MGYGTETRLVYGVKLNARQARNLEYMLREELGGEEKTIDYSFEDLITKLNIIDFSKENYSHDVVLRGEDADIRANSTNGYNDDCSAFIFGVENWLAISTNKRKGPSQIMKDIWENKLKDYAEKVGVTDSPNFHLISQTI